MLDYSSSKEKGCLKVKRQKLWLSKVQKDYLDRLDVLDAGPSKRGILPIGCHGKDGVEGVVVWTNEKRVLGHVISIDQWEASIYLSGQDCSPRQTAS